MYILGSAIPSMGATKETSLVFKEHRKPLDGAGGGPKGRAIMENEGEG